MFFSVVLAPANANAEDHVPDLIAILDHAAIVEDMVRACGHARPDLGDKLAEARTAWWQRNSIVQETIAELKRDARTSPESKSLLQYYEALKEKFIRDLPDSEVQGNARLMNYCETVLQRISNGALDYPMEEEGI